jgi:hypothetical protein
VQDYSTDDEETIDKVDDFGNGNQDEELRMKNSG